ncbi:MAG: thioesterase family protein [Chitinophagaceae bacterium]|nr:thioesterase family protein [Chitinophagaceae bacterium]
MSRIKIELPEHFSFYTKIPVRITDINYGGHVGNDSILSIIHEARMQFLKNKNLDELNFGGFGLIMRDVAIEFKNELFYGEDVKVAVHAADFSKIAFSIYYKIEKSNAVSNEKKIIALAKTGMVCFDYPLKKVMAIPSIILEKFIQDINPLN